MANTQSQQNTTLSKTINFMGVSLTIYVLDGKPWIPASHISKALWNFNRRRAAKLYHSYHYFFDEGSACTVEPSVLGLEGKDILLLSEQGALIMAMLSRSDMAWSFRNWLVQVMREFRQTTPELFTIPKPLRDANRITFHAIQELLEKITLRLDAITSINSQHHTSNWLRDKLVDEAKKEVRIIVTGLYDKEYPSIYASSNCQEANEAAMRFREVEGKVRESKNL